jgi:hypothetical protein
MIAIILDVVAIVGLIGQVVFLQGSYGVDLRRLDTRIQKVETQAAYLVRQVKEQNEPPSYEAFLQAGQDVDQQIIRARDRNRS